MAEKISVVIPVYNGEKFINLKHRHNRYLPDKT